MLLLLLMLALVPLLRVFVGRRHVGGGRTLQVVRRPVVHHGQAVRAPLRLRLPRHCRHAPCQRVVVVVLAHVRHERPGEVVGVARLDAAAQQREAEDTHRHGLDGLPARQVAQVHLSEMLHPNVVHVPRYRRAIGPRLRHLAHVVVGVVGI